MKVLSMPDLTWSAETECKTCGARLFVEMADMKYDPYDRKFYCVCVVCECTIFTTKALPWFVKRKASAGAVQF